MLASAYDIIILLGVTMVLVGIPITVIEHLFGAVPPKEIQYLLFLSVTYAYFVGFWVKGGATTGMRPWKLVVAMSDSGDPLSWYAASVRFAALMTTWLSLSVTLWFMATRNTDHFLFLLAAAVPAVSMLVMALGRDRLALQDIASGSSVFRVR